MSDRVNHENRRGKPRIVATVGTCSGHPRIDGTRMPVHNVLGAIIAMNTTWETVRVCYPHLTNAEIDACIEYAIKAVKKQRAER